MIKDFGKGEFTSEMKENAARCLLQLLGREECLTFDELCYNQVYDSGKKLSLKNLVCCSSTIHLHIKRAYLQTNIWMNAATICPDPLNPTVYGYRQTEHSLEPELTAAPTKPTYLPQPCKCCKCSTKRCSCRQACLIF